MTINRPVIKSAMSTKKVHRAKRIISNTTETIKDFTKTDENKRILSFVRGVIVGASSVIMITTNSNIVGVFLGSLNLISITYGLEEVSKTPRDKMRPKKIKYL